ncbi:hypothetical protein BC937DRAFT_92964 [Endogone sp. FLAS-F59071]|nr:hypothetical protein BC937DRAFT_92964 [Endogone sp. FLAS-F59071]|eukprot:RUS15053.1 hypothetical protein BC937DRAFT_92964 [Endogone sp. FLAS-F59071]
MFKILAPFFRPTNWLVVALLPVIAPLTLMLTAGLSFLAIVTSALTSSVVFLRLVLLAAEFGFSLTLSYVSWITKTSVEFVASGFWGWNDVEREHDEMLAMRKTKPKKGSDTEDEKFLQALQAEFLSPSQGRKRPPARVSAKSERVIKGVQPANIPVTYLYAAPAKPQALHRQHSLTQIDNSSAPVAYPQKRSGHKVRLPKSAPGSPAYAVGRKFNDYDLKKMPFIKTDGLNGYQDI